MVTDSIGDMINRINNACRAGKESVSIPYSNLKFAIAEVLRNEGFVGEVSKKGKKVKKHLEIDLLYIQDNSKIKGAERVSKPSRRMYVGWREIKPVKYGKGRLIVSTPQGIMTGESAKTKKLGGEALFKIW